MRNTRKRQLKKAVVQTLGRMPKLVYNEIEISSDNKTLHSAKFISLDPVSIDTFGLRSGFIEAQMKMF